MSDEWHQAFVRSETRYPRLVADTLGAALGAAAYSAAAKTEN